MFDLLPETTRATLLRYPCVAQYLEGKIHHERLAAQLAASHDELVHLGIPGGLLTNLATLDEESALDRTGACARMNRFLRHIGVPLMDAQAKAGYLARVPFRAFMDLLATIDGLLLGRAGFLRWPGRAVHSMVSGMLGAVVDLEPPEDAHTEFQKFFYEMQHHVDEKRLELVAAQLYMALIFGHMFENGNGRTARALFVTLTGRTPPDQSQIIARPHDLTEITILVQFGAFLDLFNQEGIPVANNKEMFPYFATEDETYDGAMSHLKYLAARRALNDEGLRTDEMHIVMGAWPASRRQRFVYHYRELRVRWFHQALHVVEENEAYVLGVMKRALGVR